MVGHLQSHHTSSEDTGTAPADSLEVAMISQFGCGVCDFICDQRESLHRHMAIHAGESQGG